MPPPPNDKLKKLHENLIKEGYDLPDYETFGKDMADSVKRDKFYNNLVKEGYDLPDFKTFTIDMGYGEKKKEVENTASTSLGGLLPVQSQQNSTLSEPNNVSDNNQTNVSMDGVSQPIPSEEKIKNLHPDYYQEIQKAKTIASENPAIAQDINNSISDANKFSDMVIGKLSEDGKQYIDEKGNTLTQFKEGDVVSVPKDIKLNDGQKHKTGFVQYIKNNDGSFSWRSVTPPDPSFSMAKENQPQDLTVIGSKELKIPEFQRKIEDITGVKLMQPFTSPEDWQKDVDKLPPNLQEFSLYNKDNDKGTGIPKFLINHPEIAIELNYELQRAPNSRETSYGRYNATVKAINTAYNLNTPIESAFKTNDPNQLVDAPAFYKNFEAINKGHEEARKLQDKIDLLGNNPKYKDQVSKLLLQQKSIMDGLKPNMEFMQDPKNSLVLQNMENNEQLAQKQKKGLDLIRGMKNFFPQMRADEFKAAEEEQKAHDNPLNYLNNPLTAAYREAKKALIDFGGWIVEKGMQNPIPSSIDPMAKKRREWASAIDELINRENANNLTPNTGNVASDFLTHTAGTVGSLVTAFGGGAGVGKRVANAITFGVGAMQNAGREASAEGMTEKDASQYKTVNGILMGLLGYGLGGGNILKKEFTPSADLISRLLNKDTQELAAKELSNEIVKNGLIEGAKETGKAGLKMGLEMKAISIANAINNQILNEKGGYTLPETITDFSADMANVLTGSLLHLGTAAITSKGRSTPEQEAAQKAMVYKAAQGHTKEVLESLDAAEKMPNADKQAISKIRDAVIESESKNFPSDATPEQIAQALSFATKISEIDKKLETTDKEFTTKLNSDKKEAQEKIDEIMANPEKAKKDVAKEIKPIEDEFKKVTQPIGEIGRNDAAIVAEKTIENGSKDIQEPVSETIGEVKENVRVPTEEKGVVKEGIDKENIKQDQSQIKTQENAIQEQGARSVLQYPQEGIGTKGSERKGMEQGIEGQDIAKQKEKIVDIFDRMEEAQRSKKTNKGKSEVMYEVAKENGEVGEKAFFIQDNFREIVNRMKILKDETGNSILKIEC